MFCLFVNKDASLENRMLKAIPLDFNITSDDRHLFALFIMDLLVQL